MNKKECLCGANYEKAKKIIEEANKNVKYRYIQGPKGDVGPQGEIGPTGPQGEAGPQGPKGENGGATIEVGMTETISPESEALVTNVGTNRDVILNFKIPRGLPGEKGEQGETGPIGPRGLPGEIGRSEVITIDGTETIEPDELAEVQDDFDANIHHLTFYIPKGEKGEKGEQGEAGPQGPSAVAAYGERYLYEKQELNLSAEVDTLVPLNEDGPFLSTNYDTENAISITQEGVYQITYLFSAVSPEDTTLTISVKSNDLLLIAGNAKIDMKANQIGNVSNSIIANLINDDVITLNVRSTKSVNLSFDGVTSVVLSVVKIN